MHWPRPMQISRPKWLKQSTRRSGIQLCGPRCLFFGLLVLTPTLLLNWIRQTHFSSHKHILSIDIERQLNELEGLVRDAGEGAAELRERLLRQAAGDVPRRPDVASQLMIELLSSIKSFGNGPPCAAAYGPPLGDAFNVSVCSDGCFFASNLYNSFDILPNYIAQLLAVLGSLESGAAAGRSFVSIYESGSTDKTPALLRVLARLLHILDVPNRVIAGGKLTRAAFARRGWWPLGVGGPVDRIRFLAAARNAVLEPLTDPRCGAYSAAATSTAAAAAAARQLAAGDAVAAWPGPGRL